MAEVSPMMQHYLQTKEQYKDCILFYRLGDFYEMFFDDAIMVSKELELTLTGKNCGLEERAPMCGVPFHAADSYINRLVSNGHKVAICEQMEDPKQAKGIVKREVIRVVTPGTNTDMASLDEAKNNYIMSIVYTEDKYGIATCDVTTGDFFTTEVDTERKLLDEVSRFNPSEIICNEAFYMSGIDVDDMKNRLSITVSALDSWYFSDGLANETLLSHFHVQTINALGLEDYESGVIAAGALLKYLYETQMNSLDNILELHPYSIGKYMIIDSSSRRNLELVDTLREKQKRGSLLWVLDKTRTAMGARLLRTYVEQPLIEKAEIIKRQKLIEALNANEITRDEIREYLNPIYDLERLITRITYQSANPRDLIAFRDSLKMLPPIKQQLSDIPCELTDEINEEFDELKDIYELLLSSIEDEPPISQRDGDIIKAGYNEEVDRLRDAKTKGKTWLAELEAGEREKTGIKNLRIKYNKVFGYYLEVTNSFKDMVPDYYVRKQTLTNCERYITQDLKDVEGRILGAKDRSVALEYNLFDDVRKTVSDNLERIQKTAKAIANLDVITSLANVAADNRYIRPDVNLSTAIRIKDSRHPVVEALLKDAPFVPNDVSLDSANDRVAIITGPNMAGKSTYMRQIAIIVLMAQIGSFVPASSAEIGIVDSIFTRVGASDDLASGQSTFMVEMSEVANIIKNATSKSLLILDEIGRGTSTFDGMSIARAVLEFCADRKKLGAKTLFATHYHELTVMEQLLDGVKNYNIAVKKRGDDITFLRRIVPGGADDSYGIEVAKLAGIPQSVISRAKEILKDLEHGKYKNENANIQKQDNSDDIQLSLIGSAESPVIEKLKDTDINTLTPIEAMNLLYELKGMI